MADEFTLADYERISPDNLNKAVARTWREASPIMDMLRFRTSTNLSEKILRYNNLNAPTWRKIGESFTQSKINPEPIEERIYFMGKKIDVPYEYVKAQSLSDIRADWTKAEMESIAYGFNNAFLIGTPQEDEDEIVGLWYRILNDFGTGQQVDGGDLDISVDTSATSWQAKLFDLVDETMRLVDGNPGDKNLIMGKTFYRRFQAACRTSGLLATTKDQLGRQFLTYGEGGPKIIYAGQKYDQSTEIMTDVWTENTSLTSGAESGLFCVRFGAPYVEGWCQEMPNAEDVGLTEDRVNYRTIVRFSPGIFISHPRSVSMLYDIVAA
jgi:hypothetical protein